MFILDFPYPSECPGLLATPPHTWGEDREEVEIDAVELSLAGG